MLNCSKLHNYYIMSYMEIRKNKGKLNAYDGLKRSKSSIKSYNLAKFSASPSDSTQWYQSSDERLSFTRMLGNRSQSVLKPNDSLGEPKHLPTSKSTFGLSLQDYKGSTRNSIINSTYFSV
eukprot:TRINITY_DN15378_c0_g1_i1.p1 TRINITY_DN15378_c0_g1~~TRINITY_DN15378_c0_g1_i1.p1  ORF type:complete len:121 (+),score=13.14 TRINITY_DN15378_c0_g1_i1:71-433(+)